MQDQNSSTKPLPSAEHCALADGFASPDNVVDIKPNIALGLVQVGVRLHAPGASQPGEARAHGAGQARQQTRWQRRVPVPRPSLSKYLSGSQDYCSRYQWPG